MVSNLRLAERLQEALDYGRKTYGVPGVSAAVFVPGEGLWAGASGRESLLNGRQVSPATFFNVGSVTKTFVAALVLDLAADGVLRLDDPLASWLPRYPNARRITLRQLLNHTSGLSDYTRNPAFWAAVRSGATTNPRFKSVEGVLSFTPQPAGRAGEVLGVLELRLPVAWPRDRTRHQLRPSPGEQLHRRLLAQLRVRDLVYPAEEPIRQPLAHGYVDVDEDGGPDDVVSLLGIRAGRRTDAFGWTDGGVVATARALAHWGQAVYGGGVLPPRWRREMLTFHPSERGASYGLGVERDRGLRGTRVRLGHGGDNAGYRAELRYYPDAKATIAVLWNDGTVPFGLIEYDLARVVVDHLDDEAG